MTHDEFSQLLALVALDWPSFTPSAEVAAAWGRMLLDVDARAAVAAVDSLYAEGREFAPNAGQIRRRAFELLAPPLPDLDQALAEVWAACAHVGRYSEPTWSHDAIAAAVDAMGGWQAVCDSDARDVFRAQFRDVYGKAHKRLNAEALMPPSVRELMAGVDLSAERALGPAS